MTNAERKIRLIVDLVACNQANLVAHRSGRLEMDKRVLHLQVNNVICEGYGCFNKATTKINVKVGHLGTIPLDLCIDCVKKFDENKRSSQMKKTRERIGRQLKNEKKVR